MLLEQILKLLEEHKANLNHFLLSVDEPSDRVNQLIESRLEYLECLKHTVDTEEIAIAYPDELYDDDSQISIIEYEIIRFNRELLKIAKSMAKDITYTCCVATVEHIFDFIDGNKKIQSLTIDAEYLSSKFLLSEYFIFLLNRATNFYRLQAAVGEQDEDDRIDVDEVCEHLSSCLGDNRLLLIVWTCGIFFYKNRADSGFKHFDHMTVYESILNEQKNHIIYMAEDFISDLSTQEKFNLETIYKGILARHIVYTNNSLDRSDAYHSNITLSRINCDQEFDGWRIIDYAAMYGDEIIIREIIRGGFDINARNSANLRAIEIAIQYGQDTAILALLNIELGVTEGFILSDSQRAHINTHTHEDFGAKTLLEHAIQHNKPSCVRLLLQLGMDPNQSSRQIAFWSVQSPLRYALGLYHCDCALILMQENIELPVDYDFESYNYAAIKTFIEYKKSVERWIDTNNIDQLNAEIGMGRIKHGFLTIDNMSLAFYAFLQKKYDIFALLRSKGFSLRECEQSTTVVGGLSDTDKKLLKSAITNVVHQKSYSTVIFLLSKSRVLQDKQHYYDYLKNIYNYLVQIPNILYMLQVLEYGGNPLDIIFDFESANVEQISASPGLAVVGSCEYKNGIIYIGGKVDHQELLGTVAHELTHQAMQYVFNFDSNPFSNNNAADTLPIKDRLQSCINEAKHKSKDDIIKRVFTVYKEKDWNAEIIVRVPHILAKYGNSVGMQILEKEVPLLYEFYSEHTISECKAYVENIKQRGVNHSAISPELSLDLLTQQEGSSLLLDFHAYIAENESIMPVCVALLGVLVGYFSAPYVDEFVSRRFFSAC